MKAWSCTLSRPGDEPCPGPHRSTARLGTRPIRAATVLSALRLARLRPMLAGPRPEHAAMTASGSARARHSSHVPRTAIAPADAASSPTWWITGSHTRATCASSGIEATGNRWPEAATAGRRSKRKARSATRSPRGGTSSFEPTRSGPARASRAQFRGKWEFLK